MLKVARETVWVFYSWAASNTTNQNHEKGNVAHFDLGQYYCEIVKLKR
jgi:hypothetical protein